MTTPYWKKLKDPRWQKLRLEVMQEAKFTCKMCRSKTETLAVHHINYRKGAEPWEHDLGELACLCEPCHKLVETDLIPRMRMLVTLAEPLAIKGILEALEFVLGHPGKIDTTKAADEVIREAFKYSRLMKVSDILAESVDGGDDSPWAVEVAEQILKEVEL